jgi:hypothetical protein
MFSGDKMEEENSPFFGVFPDDKMMLYINYRDVLKEVVVVEEVSLLPFRGEGWSLKKSVFTERCSGKNSDSRDFWFDPSPLSPVYLWAVAAAPPPLPPHARPSPISNSKGQPRLPHEMLHQGLGHDQNSATCGILD